MSQLASLAPLAVLFFTIVFLVYIISNQNKQIKSLQSKIQVFIDTEKERKSTSSAVPMKVNQDGIRSNEAKVVDIFPLPSFTKEKTSLCRCWKSKNFPYCDGSHNEFNKKNNDNTGPAVIVNPAAAVTPPPAASTTSSSTSTSTGEKKSGEDQK